MTNPRTEGRYLTDESYVLERTPVQPKLRYPEELLAERVKELEAENAHLRDDCEDGCVYCAAQYASAGQSDLAPGIVSPSVNLDVVRTDNPSVGLVFKLSEGGTTYPVHSITMIGSSND